MTSPACFHRSLEGNIQEFVFTEVSRRAIDELFDILEQLHIEGGEVSKHANPSLIDASVGLQPLNYAFIKIRPLIARYPLMRRARVAMLVPSSPLLKTIDVVMRSIAPVRFYQIDQREAALAWLRESPDFRTTPQPR